MPQMLGKIGLACARVSKDGGGPDRAATCFETHRSAPVL